ncbi:MAG: hypothetical protein WDN04_23340 [Rhodospirillales bacterium]
MFDAFGEIADCVVGAASDAGADVGGGVANLVRCAADRGTGGVAASLTDCVARSSIVAVWNFAWLMRSTP